MDARERRWRNPLEKRTYLIYYFFYLSLLLRHHAAAVDNGYSQEQKSEVPDPNKLDSLSNFLPYDSREDPEYKRGSAFFPLRGKKHPGDDSVGDHQLFDQGYVEDKRSQFFPLRGKKIPDDLKRASYFMPMRGRKNNGWTSDDYDVTDESPNKRASAFMPMRGKKKYAGVSDYVRKTGTYSSDINDILYPSSSHIYPIEDKRMQSFVPVRGKRSYKEMQDSKLSNHSKSDEISNHSIAKRSASFMPMRGRREPTDDESTSNGIVTSLLEKRMHSFMPMRGRRGDDYNDDYPTLDKKAAAFMPMRGKKDDEDIDLGNDDLGKSTAAVKRTQLRDVVYDASNIPQTESKLIADKRFAFMPMRGRRTMSLESSEMHNTLSREEPDFSLDKKASAFMPMRGRKSEESEDAENTQHSLIRQKRSAFMPMRGRRLETTDEDEDFKVDPWPADQLYSLLDKKSSAFMPMRGRRSDDEDFTVAPWQPDQLMSLFNKKSSFMPMRGRRTNADNGSGDLDSEDIFDKRSSSFLPMRGRRMYGTDTDFDYPYPYLMAGIGSSLMSKPYSDKGVSYSSVRSSARRKKLKINWDAVKRAFHASRGKRFNDSEEYFSSLKDNYSPDPQVYPEDDKASPKIESEKIRAKRSIIRPRVSLQHNRQYIALKRPMSFFATRGKRLDDSAVDAISQLP